MDDTTAALLRANLHDVFGERDADRRRQAAHRTYSADVTFRDETGVVTGPDAVADRAGAILADAPAGFSFADDGPAYGDDRRAALPWRFGPPEAEPVARGLDLVTVAEGRITTLETMLVT